MSNLTSVITREHSSLATPISNSFKIDNQPDVIAQLLADKRSPNTQRAYRKDLYDFFKVIANLDQPSRDIVLEFLDLEQTQAVQLVFSYKAKLIEKELKEATINRRLAAIKSLVAMGRKIGVCNYTLGDVKGEKTKPYRDTSGVDRDTFRKVLSVPNRNQLKGIRDYALLRLLWGNALRRSEISLLNINDFNTEDRVLSILGKGKGTEKQTISLPSATALSISEWLIARRQAIYYRSQDFNLGGFQSNAREMAAPEAPLFIAVDNANYGRRLTGNGIYTIVDNLCKKAGISKKMSPHRIRHSSITAALDATDGNIRKVQKLSRHANINTLMTYDDNRVNYQEEMSQLLDDLI